MISALFCAHAMSCCCPPPCQQPTLSVVQPVSRYVAACFMFSAGARGRHAVFYRQQLRCRSWHPFAARHAPAVRHVPVISDCPSLPTRRWRHGERAGRRGEEAGGVGSAEVSEEAGRQGTGSVAGGGRKVVQCAQGPARSRPCPCPSRLLPPPAHACPSRLPRRRGRRYAASEMRKEKSAFRARKEGEQNATSHPPALRPSARRPHARPPGPSFQPCPYAMLV